MISLEDLIEHVKKTTDGNIELIVEIKRLYYNIVKASPADRFDIIYSMVGPDMDTLCNICDLFDITVEYIEIRYSTEGVEYVQQIDVLDEDSMDDDDDDYRSEDDDTVDRLYDSLISQGGTRI